MVPGCTGSRSQTVAAPGNEYAALFSVHEGNSRTDLLVRKTEDAPWDTLQLRRPLRRIVCLSSSYLAFLNALDAGPLVCAVSGARFISDTSIQRGIAEGRISDIGYDGSLDFERLMELDPDLILAYEVNDQDNSALEKMRRLGLPVAVIPDYMEQHPLGKLEYLRLFGALLGKQKEADSIFRSRCEAYVTLRERVRKAGLPVQKVLINTPWRDTWYIPGDRMNFAQLVRDAGGCISGARPGSTISRACSFEEIFILAADADYWLHPGMHHTLAGLEKENPLYRNIPVFRENKVYNNTLRSTPGGGNDFWETGVTEPHLILEDLVRILHPGLLPDAPFHYYIHVK